METLLFFNLYQKSVFKNTCFPTQASCDQNRTGKQLHTLMLKFTGYEVAEMEILASKHIFRNK